MNWPIYTHIVRDYNREVGAGAHDHQKITVMVGSSAKNSKVIAEIMVKKCYHGFVLVVKNEDQEDLVGIEIPYILEKGKLKMFDPQVSQFSQEVENGFI